MGGNTTVAYDFCMPLLLSVRAVVYWNARRGGALDVAVQASLGAGYIALGFAATYGLMNQSRAVLASHEAAAPETYLLITRSPRVALRDDTVLTLAQKAVTKEAAANLLTFSFTALGIADDTPAIVYGWGLISPLTGLPLRHVSRGWSGVGRNSWGTAGSVHSGHACSASAPLQGRLTSWV